MICVVIKGPSIEEAHQQISEAILCADIVELRLDLFNSPTISQIRHLRNTFSIPMIFTLRSALQGGNYQESEDQRLLEIDNFAALNPAFVDIESHIDRSFLENFRRNHPHTKIILSYHDFEGMSFSLVELYDQMSEIPAHFYKIALTPKNTNDALRLLSWAKQHAGKIIVIGMGSYGQITRILAPIFGIPMTYASLNNSQITAPGQLTASTLIEQYHYRSLSPKTSLYGLIGDPVDLSVSDVSHNQMFLALKLDAIYVKMPVKEEELIEFISLAKKLDIKGLSVTMPLKEKIIPFLDQIDSMAKKIGAVNTLHFKEGKVTGYNTDGVGALDAIEKQIKVSGQRVVILGAGGAAKAIAYEATERGAKITLINRNVEKAFNMAQEIRAHLLSMNEMSILAVEGYDILINCTPNPMPISSEHIRKKAVIMDIRTKPKTTPFIEAALKKGCPVVYGYEMFIEQALGQFKIWFGDQFSAENARSRLEISVKECIIC